MQRRQRNDLKHTQQHKHSSCKRKTEMKAENVLQVHVAHLVRMSVI
jgi:hypothetical protein